MLPPELITRYHTDPESVYHTWFLDESRLKAFRTIRRGIQVLAHDLETGAFPNDYRGSALETVVEAIAEQKQVFAGAAHPFYWKPKLRIPDIYESRENQRRYAAFLKAAHKSADPEFMVTEILRLANPPIKGLGPATGNMLYFLHPTHFPPFNTAIVQGFNILTSQRLKLGDWNAYLQMREGMKHLIEEGGFSKDMGDIAGLCFEIGAAHMLPPHVLPEDQAALLTKLEKESTKRRMEITTDLQEAQEHAEQQGRLAELGLAWGYRVWIARNDHARRWSKGPLGELSVDRLPVDHLPAEVRETLEFIDVLWLDPQNEGIIAGFEVEKSTSIFSCILRLYDLAISVPACRDHLYLVAPDQRERDVQVQLRRPSLSASGATLPEYILFTDLACNCAQMARFGTGIATLKRLSRKA